MWREYYDTIIQTWNGSIKLRRFDSYEAAKLSCDTVNEMRPDSWHCEVKKVIAWSEL